MTNKEEVIKSLKDEATGIVAKVENEKRSRLTKEERRRFNEIELRVAEIKNNKMEENPKVDAKSDKRFDNLIMGEDRANKNIFAQMARAAVSGQSENRTLQASGSTIVAKENFGITDALAAESVLGAAGVPFLYPEAGVNPLFPVQTGQASASWIGEGSQIVESTPTFVGREAGINTVACEVRVSRQLLASSPDVDAAVQRIVARQVAKGIEQAAFADSNVSNAFTSLTNISGVDDIYSGATNGTTLSNWGAYADLKKAMRAADVNNPLAFFMHSDLEADFGQLVDSNGQPMIPPSYIFEEVNDRTFVSSLFETDLTKGSGTGLSNIIAMDPSLLRVVMKDNMSMRLNERRSDYLEVVFMAWAMVDVIALHPEAIKYAGAVKF